MISHVEETSHTCRYAESRPKATGLRQSALARFCALSQGIACHIEKCCAECYLVATSYIQEDRSLSYTDTTSFTAQTETKPVLAISSDAILNLVLSSLEDDKAEDIVTIDLRGKTALADHMVICSGRSTRQVAAIAQKLLDRLKESFRLSARSEGKDVGDWVLIDAGDVVVHVFRPEVREFYQLEKMWLGADGSPSA